MPWSLSIPNLEVYAPADEPSLRRMMEYAARRDGPTLIRYPRGALPPNLPTEKDSEWRAEDSLTLTRVSGPDEGSDWALLGHGIMVHTLLEVRERAKEWEGSIPLPAVFDIRRLKPLDMDALDKILRRFRLVAVAEENYLAGGVGEAVATRIAEGRYRSSPGKGPCPLLRRFGVPNVCVPHATSEEQRALYGMTAGNILDVCATALKTQIR